MNFLVTFKNNHDDDKKSDDGSECLIEPTETGHIPVWYKLVDGNPVPCYDITGFEEWYGNIENRRIDFTKIAKGCDVSTVFLGIDHNFGDGEPVLFETLVSGEGKIDGWMWRYRTIEEAKAGHQKVVDAVKNGEDLEKLDI